ncbi:hypothetical protein [Alkalibacillus haloalkaliphilus]|uniref:hypothetical protein n=1 Tax=Alkalibacillus haloalkaliphilus TaxID=94136 RepID=UPI00031EE073|nr:hypothetical protein [Alkalibacillus haloalkaliphilus]
MKFEPSYLYSKAEELYKEGLSCSQIGDLLGLNRKKVSSYLKSKGIQVKVIAGNHNKEEIKQKYLKGEELFIDGMSIRSITKKLHLGRQGFSYWLKKRGHIIKSNNNYKPDNFEEKLLLGESIFKKEKSVLIAAREAKVSYYALLDFLDEKGIDTQIDKRYKINENVFENIDTPEKSYWLGFLYADGYINKERNYIELTLKESDKLHIEKFKKFLSTSTPIKNKEIIGSNGKLYKACTLFIYRKKIMNDLINLGCIENKSLKLSFPQSGLIPKELIRDFVRGYFDGDGSLNFSSRRNRQECTVNFIGTRRFLEELRKELDLPTRKLDRNGQAFSLRYSGVKIPLRVLEYMYKDAGIYLERKYNRYLEFLDIRDKVEIDKLAHLHKKDERYQKAAKLFLEGKSIRYISKRLGISRDNLSTWLKLNGYKVKLSRPFSQKELEYRKSQKQEIIGMHEEGYSISKIRRNTGCNFYTIKKIIELNNPHNNSI